MAKKLSKQQSKARRLEKARARGNVGPLLKEALRMLRRGNTDRALRLAADARKHATEEEEQEAVRQVMAEIHFRAALQNPATQRLARLEAALEAVPQDARLHYHRAIALWRAGRLREAAQALDTVAEQEPDRPGVRYLRQLARLALGKRPSMEGLSEAEANTLDTVQQLLGKSKGTIELVEPQIDGAAPLWRLLSWMQAEATVAPDALLEEAAEAVKNNPGAASILHYYRGVAALRAGQPEVAHEAWLEASNDGFMTPWLEENMASLLRERAVEYASQERWDAVAEIAARLPETVEDRILAETIGLAYFHLGYLAAQKQQWQRAVQQWRRAAEWHNTRLLAQNLALAEEALENWPGAAEAWREMARRRPRSATHPDYLDDNQVAALWRHAAACYNNVDDFEEAIACLKTALKYAGKDTELRLELVDQLMNNNQPEAAGNELERILEIEPDNVEALIRLGTLRLDQWGADSISLWRRALAVDPKRVEARDGLTAAYNKKLEWSWYLSEKERAALLEEAMELLGNHPPFLVRAALFYRTMGKEQKALDALLHAYEIAPDDVQIASLVLHELLHFKNGDKKAREILPQVRTIPRLLPAFWFEQAEQALQCELDEAWVQEFLDEGVALAGEPYVEDSLACLLMNAYEVLDIEGAEALRARYAQRIRAEVPKSGGVEFVAALDALARGDQKGAQRQFKAAKRLARRAKDQSAVDFIEEIEFDRSFSGGELPPLGLLARLMERFPGGLPSPEELEKLPDEFFEDFL